MLAIRIMTEFESKEARFEDTEDQKFMDSILRYYSSQLELDDMPLWTQEDLAYYDNHTVGKMLDKG